MYRILPMCASSSFYPRPIARTVRQGFSSPEWDLTKCLAYLNFREFYSSTLTVHSEDLEQNIVTVLHPFFACCLCAA